VEFETVFKNKSRQRVYDVWEHTGEFLIRVPPGEHRTVVSELPTTTYARWSEVEVDDISIQLTERSGWEEPARGGDVTLELENINGDELEYREIDGRRVLLPRGIPVRIGIPLQSPWVWFARIEIRRRMRRCHSERYEGYCNYILETNDIKIARTEAELATICGLQKERSIEPLEFPVTDETVIDDGSEETVWTTKFKNLRDRPVRVFDERHNTMFVLEPGMERMVDSWTATTMYSRYSTVKYLPDNKVEVHQNRKWQCPYEGLTLEIENRDSSVDQSVRVGERYVTVPPGLSRIVPVDLFDQLAEVKKISFELVTRPQGQAPAPGYKLEMGAVLEEIKTLRPQKELDAIRAERERENHPGAF